MSLVGRSLVPRKAGNERAIMRELRCMAAVLLVAMWGCAAALVGVGGGAGVGTYSYIKGELRVTYAQYYSKVVSATEQAVKDLGFTIKKESKDKLRCRIKAEMADGTGVKLAVDKVSKQITQLRIKVGWWGNKNLSIQIMRAIEKRMGVSPAVKSKS